MRIGALILGIAILGVASVASIETASARVNCGPGMNSDGYRCFPAWQRHEYGRAYGYYPRRHYRGDYYYQAPRRARGGGCYGPTGIYDPRGC